MAPKKLLRVGAATGFAVLITVAVLLLVGSDSGHRRTVAQAQIDRNGQPVAVGETVPANPAGNGTAICPPLSIAMAGALTGPDSELGNNIKNGVQLAIDRHNAANVLCQVQIKEFDTRGDPQRVSEFAPQIVADAYTVGLIGPTFSGVAAAAGSLFEANGLPAATASASRSSLSEQGWRTFFRAVASDEAQGRAVANYLKNTLRDNRICVVSDNSPYGDAVAQAARATLGDLALADCGPDVDRIKSAAPNVVLRTGSYTGAGEFLRQLRDGGVTAEFMTVQGRVDEQAFDQAGGSAADAVLFCPCGPYPEWFVTAYSDTFGHDPGAYSAEGYDLATIMLTGIDAGMLVRPQMLDWMRHYNGQGVARRYQWTETGELSDPTVWIYEVH